MALVTPASTRLAAVALAIVVVTFGAALRLDALTMKFGPVERPAWLQSLQTAVAAGVAPIRPAGFVWPEEPLYPHRDGPPTRYISDPYTYLGFARQMPSFYAAHYREPLFVLATRVWLWLLDNQDVAVSFASMTFSTAAVGAVLALGWYAFSPWVGLGAGVLMAIEYELVSWGISGWRDEAFVAVVPLWALALLRVARDPTPAAAATLGGVGALALLVRITALSFVLPSLLFLAVAGRGRWQPRVVAASLAGLVTLAMVAPYLVNCWRVHGDPLYAINYHAGYYAPAGQEAGGETTVADLVQSAARTHPFRTVDAMATGLTVYPFANKWNGYDVWVPGLGTLLSWLALAGLVAFAGSSPGRMILGVGATSLLPFSLTWQQLGDWRFTEHAYGFFLLAACVAAGRAVTFARWVWRARSDTRPPARRVVVFWSVVAATIALAAWTGTRLLPRLVFAEAAALGETAVIEAGRRDAAFFGTGWSAPAPQGAITVRDSDGFPSVIHIPLRESGDYDLRLRLDPVVPAGFDTAGAIRVFLNGRPVGRLALGYDPERVGAYDVRLPRSVTRAGRNRLELVLESSLAHAVDGDAVAPSGAFKLWYVLVRAVPRD